GVRRLADRTRLVRAGTHAADRRRSMPGLWLAGVRTLRRTTGGLGPAPGGGAAFGQEGIAGGGGGRGRGVVRGPRGRRVGGGSRPSPGCSPRPTRDGSGRR